MRRLISRVLYRTGACEPLPLIGRSGDVRIRFRRSLLAANVWADPHAYRPMLDAIRRVVRPGDTVVDVGAHIGLHALTAAAAAGNDGVVIACEPHPVTFRWLAENIALNASSSVSARQVAVGNSPGRHGFSDLAEEDLNRLETDGPVTVDVVRLDDLHDGPVRLLKIDVEGSELDVLASGPIMLAQTDAVLIEAWDVDATRSVLSDFDISVITQSSDAANLLAVRR